MSSLKHTVSLDVFYFCFPKCSVHKYWPESFKSSMPSRELHRHWLVWNLRVRKTTQMFIIKHKSSFTDLKLLALRRLTLIKMSTRSEPNFFLFQCSIYIEVAVEKESAKRTAVGLLTAPQGSVSDSRLPRALFPGGPKGASFGLKDLPWWQQQPALSCGLSRASSTQAVLPQQGRQRRPTFQPGYGPLLALV